MACLHHLHHLLPEQNEAVVDDPVVVVMSEQPVVELGSLSDILQEVGQVVVNISTVPQYVHDAAWGTVGDHIVHLIVNAFQIAPSFFILGLAGKLLFPPGVMVDPETGAHSSESPILFFKIRCFGIQNTIINIVTPGAAHGEEGISLQVEDLTTHQMDHMGPNALDFSTVPFFYGVFPQQVEVFVVAADKQRGERQVFQPVQAAGILFAAFPYAAEVAADDHKVIPGHLGLLWEMLGIKPLEVAVGIACGIDHDNFTFFRSLYHILVNLDAAPEIYCDFLGGVDLDRIHQLSDDMKIILDVIETTGITATAGIGTNLYLCKVAMDIVAKHIPADKNGVRIAELDEMRYRETMWSHQPLTDFWRVGRGYAKKLESHGMFTMGDVARMSVINEDLLYQLFGKNAELLIDHAWGWEPCTIEAVKAYRPADSSLGSGQVLHCPYTAEKARLVLREMAELLALDLVSKKMVTDQIVVTVGFDIENLTDPVRRQRYHGPIVKDHYGREVPKHAHGTERLSLYTSSTKKIMEAASALFDRIVDSTLLVRRLNIVAGHVISEREVPVQQNEGEQMDLFTDYAALDAQRKQEQAALAKERKMQEAMLSIKNKFGKNAILKGMNLEDGATAKDRNAQIGGHRA